MHRQASGGGVGGGETCAKPSALFIEDCMFRTLMVRRPKHTFKSSNPRPNITTGGLGWTAFTPQMCQPISVLKKTQLVHYQLTVSKFCVNPLC
jgi:hypothetical protein